MLGSRKLRKFAPSLFLVAACTSDGEGPVGTAALPLPLEQDKLVAGDPGLDDEFGSAVAVDGNTAVVGAPLDDDAGSSSGSAYVFTRSATTWTQQDKLTAGDPAQDDQFGHCVAIDGNTIAVGAYLDDDGGTDSGSAYVFTRSGTSWTQEDKLTAADADDYDYFGDAVALDGNTLVVGAFGDEDAAQQAGSAYVFTRSGTTWTQEDKLLATDARAGARLGRAASLDTNTALVSAPTDDENGAESGAAYVFVRSATNWTQQDKLQPTGGEAGDDFGYAVALAGDTAVAGASGDDDAADNAGAAYAFSRSATAWSQTDKVTAGDGEAGDALGLGIALSGDNLIVGAASDDDNGSSSGAAYAFARSGATWTELDKFTAADNADGDSFGTAIALSGDTAVVGARRDDDTADNSGSAYVFRLVSLADGEPCTLAAECQSGNCVDDVCCDDGCGDGDPDDCQACSIAAGAAADGTCGAVADGTSCDDGVYCNGADTCAGGTCNDHAGSPCPGPDGDADCAESCNETRNDCRANDPDGALCDVGTCQAGTCQGAGGGGTGGTGTAGGVLGDDNVGQGVDQDGCGCRLAQPRSAPSRLAALALLALGLGLWQRRRR